MKPKAYKRMTVEFFHEAEGGKLKADEMDFVQECNTGKAYGPGVLESHIVEFLEQSGMVKPRVAGIYHRLNEPPFFLLP